MTYRTPQLCYLHSRTDRVCVHLVFFFQAEDGIRDLTVTGVQTCALPIYIVLRKGSYVPTFEYRSTSSSNTVPALKRIVEIAPFTFANSAPNASAVADEIQIGRASCRERV